MNETATIIRAIVGSLEAGLFLATFAIAVYWVVEHSVRAHNDFARDIAGRQAFLQRAFLVVGVTTLLIAIDGIYQACVRG